MSDDQGQEIADLLKFGGYEAHVISDGEPGKCPKCGNVGLELRYGRCFTCFIWGAADSSDEEIKFCVSDAMASGQTVDMWLAGRQQFGEDVPTQLQVERIKRLAAEYCDDQVLPWVMSLGVKPTRAEK